MRLTDRIYVVGSGTLGFGISHDLDCNVYLVDGGREMALVDSGVGLEPERIVENIIEEGLDPQKLKYVFVTHAHADHAGGCRRWKESFGLTVFGSPEAADLIGRGDEAGISLEAARIAGIYPASYRFERCDVDGELREGDVRHIGDYELRVLETPGHCRGSLSYLMIVGAKSYLFSGDAVFHGGKILVSNIIDCDLQEYVRTIKKLATLSADALLPGHFCVVLGAARVHLDKALEQLQRLALPPNVF